jgi:hypothetical protein
MPAETPLDGVIGEGHSDYRTSLESARREARNTIRIYSGRPLDTRSLNPLLLT